jgi:hypothetical protein
MVHVPAVIGERGREDDSYKSVGLFQCRIPSYVLRHENKTLSQLTGTGWSDLLLI